MENYLWKFHWNCGRMGDIEGLFVATKDEIKNLIGKEIYFGEVLGKHSEIMGTIEDFDIEMLKVGCDVVAKLKDILGDTWCGYNPLEYLEEN